MKMYLLLPTAASVRAVREYVLHAMLCVKDADDRRSDHAADTSCHSDNASARRDDSDFVLVRYSFPWAWLFTKAICFAVTSLDGALWSLESTSHRSRFISFSRSHGRASYRNTPNTRTRQLCLKTSANPLTRP